MKNSKLGVLSAAVLLCCQIANATTLVVLVSQDSVVLGGDGKGVDEVSHHSGPIGKVEIVNDHVIVSSMGIGDILSKDGTINYTFTSWIHSLPVGRNSGAKDVALAIRDGCWSIFKGFPVDFNYGQDPLVSYYVVGTESPVPTVYWVAIPIDWSTRQTKKPTIELLYPTQQNVRVFIQWNGPDDGGIADLMQKGSAVQVKYMKLFPNIVGPAVSDSDNRPLDTDSLIKLAKIMLRLEIKTFPRQFTFPMKVCSAKFNHKATCMVYNK